MVIKCIALSEAERIYKHGSYKEDKEIDLFISNAELRLIENTFGADAVERFKNSGDKKTSNRIKLSEIRSKITGEYFPTLASFSAWGSKGDQERCDAIANMYEAIHDNMKSFIADMFLYCSEIAGPATCNYAILGLGSTSRKEGTPYSDLEFAILLDGSEGEGDNAAQSEKRAYFRFLTYFIQAQILKLGETILPSLGIASLNDFYRENKEADWFYDDMIPKGFSFDGMMPWACKTPLGRKTWRGQPPQEFVMSINEMLELQDVSPSSSKESLQTANVFSSVCHLFGDEELTTTYQKKLSAILTDTERMKTFQHQVLTVLQSLLEPCQNDRLDLRGFGIQQDVKREVYRLISLLVEQISKFFGLFGQSPWQSIKEMCERKILTVDGARNLLTALSITAELRLQCYQRHGMQKEALPTVPQLSVDAEKDSTQSSNISAIVRLYKSLMPMKMTFFQALKNQVSVDVESFMRTVLLQENFYDDSLYTRGIAYLRILQLPKALACLCSSKDNVDDASRVKILSLLAYCYRMVGKFQKVFECCREVQTLHSIRPEIVNSNDLFFALMSMMHTYMDLGLYQEALKLQEEMTACTSAPDFTEEDSIVYFLNSSAVLFMKTEQFETAENMFKCIIEKFPNPRKNYFCYFSCINNFAVLLLSEGRLTEAKTVLENALSIANELYGENAIHPCIACCLVNLSKVHYGLQNTEEGDRLLQIALVIYRHVHGHQLIEPRTVDALITQARAYQCAGKWEEMLSPLIEAKELACILYGDQPHSSIACVLFLLGHCEYLRGRFSTALIHYQDCLKIFEDCSKEIDKCTAHNCDRAIVLLAIFSLGTMCSLQDSYLLSLIQKALELEEQVHGKGSNDPHLARCYSKIGCSMMLKSHGAQGLEFLEQAIQIFQEKKLDNTYNYGHTQFAMGKVLSYLSPNKAEEHLKIAESILKKILKDENHIVLFTINSTLLHVYRKTSRIKEGLELADKVHRNFIEKRLSKSSQLSLAELYQVFKLAEFYKLCGRRNTARALYTNLISHIEEHVDPTDPENRHLMFLLWITQEAAALIFESDEMFLEAEAMFQRLAISTQKSTSQQPFVHGARLQAKWHLAAIFIQTGRDSQAHDILDGLVKTYESDPNQLVDQFVLPMSIFWLLGDLNRRRFRFNLALKDLQKALKIADDFRVKARSGKMPVKGKEVYMKVLNTMGVVYEQENQPKRAFECYKCCLDAVEGEDLTLDTAMFHQNTADILKKLGSSEDALVHYQKSLEIREMLHSEDPVKEDIATVLYHIALTQYVCGRFKEASETLDKLLPLKRNLLKKGGELQNYCAAVVLKGNCHIQRPDEAQEAKDAYEEAEKVLKKMTQGRPNKDYATVVGNIGATCMFCCFFFHKILCMVVNL